MSDPAVLELIRVQEENRRLQQRIAQFRALIDSVNETARRVYPKGPFHCVACGARTTRPRRYLCPRCYYRWYRRQQPRHLGGMKVALGCAADQRV